MQVSYMKGLASHHGPESCLDRQQWNGEALTGENTGALKSSEITTTRRQTLYNEGESKIVHTEKARDGRLRRSLRTTTGDRGRCSVTTISRKEHVYSIEQRNIDKALTQ